MKLRKSYLRLLEKVFEAEIYGRLPYQSRSKMFADLQAEGLVEPMTRSLGHDRFGAVEVSGWSLTHKGRFAYCQQCADD